jgi:hypothetical protein
MVSPVVAHPVRIRGSTVQPFGKTVQFFGSTDRPFGNAIHVT